MINNINDYIELLSSKGAGADDIKKAQAVIATKEVVEILNNPSVSKSEKETAINELFTVSVRAAVKKMVDERKLSSFKEIANAYFKELDRQSNTVTAIITCVNEPNEKQLSGLKDFVKKETGAAEVKTEIVKDPSILGGFTIEVNGKLYDRSLKTKLDEIKQSVVQNVKKNTEADPLGIISILKEDIKDYEFAVSNDEIGTVVSVGDGIATIYGLNSVMYGEIVLFESGVKGMVQNIKKDSVGCILFGTDDEISEGSRVKRTRKKAGVPVGNGFIGRVVNALGEPIDGKGEIDADDYRLVEQPAPSIVDRKSVSKPLETGILAIDSMFPIGRGQRELIIGDRQTGTRGFAQAEALVGVLRGVQEQGHLRHLVENAGDHLVHALGVAGGFDGDVDVEAVAGLAVQRLGRKVGVQPVGARHGFDDGLEGHGVVRRAQSVGIAEVDLVLAGAFFMVGALRLNAHLLQDQAYLPADVFAPVLGGNVHIARLIVGLRGGSARLVQMEQIEFLFRAETEGVTRPRRVGDSLFQQAPGIAFKGPPVGIGDAGEHTHDLSVLRPPGQQRQRFRVRVQQQIRPGLAVEAGNGRGVECNAVFKCTGQFLGHDGNVLLPAENIAKRDPNELHVLFADIFHDLCV